MDFFPGSVCTAKCRTSYHPISMQNREDMLRKKREGMVRLRLRDPKTYLEKNRAYYLANREVLRARDRERSRKTKVEALTHYGNGTLACVCCGESTLEFLAIDHIEHNGGAKERKQGLRGGRATYVRLIKGGFPPGYQTLCHNCNLAKGFYRICPHNK